VVSKDTIELINLVIDAVLHIAEEVDGKYKVNIDNVKVDKKAGDSIKDIKLIYDLDKEIVHLQKPKKVENVKVALINTTSTS